MATRELGESILKAIDTIEHRDDHQDDKTREAEEAAKREAEEKAMREAEEAAKREQEAKEQAQREAVAVMRMRQNKLKLQEEADIY